MENDQAVIGKHITLSVDEPERLYSVSKAMASEVRIRLIRLLSHGPMSVNEIADALHIPMSTAALHVRTLQEAGLIFSEVQPGTRGALKLSTRKIDSFSVSLVPCEVRNESILSMQMPVGGYSLVGDITPTCGMAGAFGSIGMEDNPRTFFHNERFGAQILWFHEGFVEYHFSVLTMDQIEVDWLEVSFEACSEAPMYRNPWESEIAVSLNQKRLGIWTSPCDCGGRRGKLNPEWWSDMSTQFGFLKTWKVDAQGSYLDDVPLSTVTLAQLHLADSPYIAVGIEVVKDSDKAGGINLFGEGFGDFQQSIQMRIGYHMKEAK